MDYIRIYHQLITRAANRDITGYTERHHIIPRCLGGSNSSQNLVSLTPEEHYIAHLLLAKIYPENHKIVYAANMMANRNNKSYGWIKRKFSRAISEQNKGQIISAETREKRSKSLKGLPKSAAWKEIISKKKSQALEYCGKTYKGYDELLKSTGISRHLYIKYYLNGIDPLPYINNKSHGMVKSSRDNPRRAALGKKWFNNGYQSKYFFPDDVPEGWNLGRLRS